MKLAVGLHFIKTWERQVLYEMEVIVMREGNNTSGWQGFFDVNFILFSDMMPSGLCQPLY